MNEQKNFITPRGFQKLEAEFVQLKRVERPQIVETVHWAAGNGDRSENGDYIYGKKRLREIDRRLAYLSKQINNAEIIDPLRVESDRVSFGATVTFEDEEGQRKTYTIVGTDELDPERGRISWKSPIARALKNSRVGDVVVFESPQGEREIEVLEIRYVEVD